MELVLFAFASVLQIAGTVACIVGAKRRSRLNVS